MEAEEVSLAARLERSSHEALASTDQQQRAEESEAALETATRALHAELEALCPAIEALFGTLSCKAPEGDGGLFALRGCRPDTLPDYLKALDLETKSLHTRALNLPSGSDKALNARLAGFTQATVVETHPSVVELRKELEAAAQKQAQAKNDAGVTY